MTTHPHQSSRMFHDPEITISPASSDEPFAESFVDEQIAQPETAKQPLQFPCTQTAIAEYVGLGITTVHQKLNTLAGIHGKSLVFTEVWGEKRVTEQGFAFLEALQAAGNIRAYRQQLADQRAAEEAANRPPVPPQQFHPQSVQFQPTGTPQPIGSIPQLALVPTHGNPAGYTAALGLPIAQPGTVARYQPTTLAQGGAGVVDLALQLNSMITQALTDDRARIDEEADAVRSQRQQLAQLMPVLKAKVQALESENVQAAIALESEKKSLAREANQVAAMAAQLGLSVNGLDGMFS